MDLEAKEAPASPPLAKTEQLKRPPRRKPSRKGLQQSVEAQAKLTELKEYLCSTLRMIAFRRRYTQKEMALLLGTSEANVSRVIRFRTDQLTVNQLFGYLAILNPALKF